MAEEMDHLARRTHLTPSRFGPRRTGATGDPLTATDFLNRGAGAESGHGFPIFLPALLPRNGKEYGTGKLNDFSQVGVKAPDERRCGHVDASDRLFSPPRTQPRSRRSARSICGR